MAACDLAPGLHLLITTAFSLSACGARKGFEEEEGFPVRVFCSLAKNAVPRPERVAPRWYAPIFCICSLQQPYLLNKSTLARGHSERGDEAAPEADTI